tara:strand:- start:6909 stop:7313 length:405 start_codon:yes stop_codon:yes gene_type:complete
MKQFNLFKKGEVDDIGEQKYSSKIEAPVYTPKNKKPHIFELCNKDKTHKLLRKIDASSLPIEEKQFLMDAARRHNIFDYEKIADYYAQSSREMQELMEESALVIIDFEKAIQNGFVRLCSEVKNQYLQEYQDEE